jgi:hypothetical protein
MELKPVYTRFALESFDDGYHHSSQDFTPDTLA